MHADLKVRRRVLQLTFQRYLDADRALTLAVREARLWFPSQRRPTVTSLGNPGSRVRRLHEQRDKALCQLEVARLKLDFAKERLKQRRRDGKTARIALISYRNG